MWAMVASMIAWLGTGLTAAFSPLSALLAVLWHVLQPALAVRPAACMPKLMLFHKPSAFSAWGDVLPVSANMHHLQAQHGALLMTCSMQHGQQAPPVICRLQEQE